MKKIFLLALVAMSCHKTESVKPNPAINPNPAYGVWKDLTNENCSLSIKKDSFLYDYGQPKKSYVYYRYLNGDTISIPGSVINLSVLKVVDSTHLNMLCGAVWFQFSKVN